MPEVTGQFNNLWTRRLDEVFFEGWDEEPEQWSKYLHPMTSNQNNETYQSFAGTTSWTAKNEMSNADEQTFNLANLIVTEHTPYGAEVIMSREYIADQKYGEIEDVTRDVGRAGRVRVEENCISVLDNAFTVACYDGQYLIDSDHAYGKTGLAGVQSNITTGALSDTTVKTGLNLFNTIKDEAGKRVVMSPSKLITHKNNQWTVATIFQSTLRSGTANNDTNPLPMLEFVYSNYLTSTTAWFIEAKQHKLIHFFRVKPEFVKRKYMNPNGSQSWDAYMRDSTEERNWRGIVGSLGT